jgi:MYXO-CTERM domain-containing protein
MDFVILKDSGIDTTTATGTLMLQILAAFSEYERNIIRERTRSGLADFNDGPVGDDDDSAGPSMDSTELDIDGDGYLECDDDDSAGDDDDVRARLGDCNCSAASSAGNVGAGLLLLGLLGLVRGRQL